MIVSARQNEKLSKWLFPFVFTVCVKQTRNDHWPNLGNQSTENNGKLFRKSNVENKIEQTDVACGNVRLDFRIHCFDIEQN